MAKPEISDVSLDIFFDFLCPYVYRAAMWLDVVKRDMGPKLSITWRYFSLEQVNNKEGPGWKLWEQPEGYASRGRLAFRAAEAARSQGEAAFDSFHLALLKARHEDRRDMADESVLLEVAEGAGLDMSGFRRELADRGPLEVLARDHTSAVETLGVFGTPTLVFSQGQAIFLKLSEVPPPEESLSVFLELHNQADRRRYIQETKRPKLESSPDGSGRG